MSTELSVDQINQVTKSLEDIASSWDNLNLDGIDNQKLLDANDISNKIFNSLNTIINTAIKNNEKDEDLLKLADFSKSFSPENVQEADLDDVDLDKLNLLDKFLNKIVTDLESEAVNVITDAVEEETGLKLDIDIEHEDLSKDIKKVGAKVAGEIAGEVAGEVAGEAIGEVVGEVAGEIAGEVVKRAIVEACACADYCGACGLGRATGEALGESAKQTTKQSTKQTVKSEVKKEVKSEVKKGVKEGVESSVEESGPSTEGGEPTVQGIGLLQQTLSSSIKGLGGDGDMSFAKNIHKDSAGDLKDIADKPKGALPNKEKLSEKADISQHPGFISSAIPKAPGGLTPED